MADMTLLERCKCGEGKTADGHCPHCDRVCTNPKGLCPRCDAINGWYPDESGPGYNDYQA